MQGDGRDDTPDIEYAKVATEDTATERSESTSPMMPMSKQHTLSTPNIASHRLMSSDEEEPPPGVSRIEGLEDQRVSELKRESLKMSARAGKGRSKSLESLKHEIGKLHLTIQYSKKDLFLFVIIHNVIDLKPEEIPGVDQVRISMVLLPTKKHRSKTKFASVDNPVYGASSKFSNVSRMDLFQSAMRFRLYGRHVRLGMHFGKERLLGELTVHLADAAQKDKVITTRPFKPPK